MAGRAIGALFGVVAAVAFALSIASPAVPQLPAWWDGAPTIDGKTYDRMDVEVGPLGARHCFDAGANCKDDVTIDSTFQMLGYGELGAIGLMELFVIVLTISIWKVGDRRTGLARTALGFAMIVAAGSALLVVVGPNVRATDHDRVLDVGVPLGAGMFTLWGAIAATGVASVLALRLKAEPLRLRPSLAYMQAPPPQDVRELVREQHDQLRPSMDAMGGAPLFEAAPQLRPLYDAQGAAPVPAPVHMPTRAPTPMDRASMRELAGMTPPPQLERPESGPIEPPPPLPPPLRVPTIADTRLKPKSLPPLRAKPPSVAPPPPRASAPALEKKTIAHAVPPPPKDDDLPPPKTLAAKDARLATENDDRLETGMRETDAITAVEIDTGAKAKYAAKQRGAAERHAAETAQMIEGSDTGIELVSRGTLNTDTNPVVRAPANTDADPVVEHTEQTTVPSPPPRAEPRQESRATTTDVEEGKPTTQMAVPITTASTTLPPPKVTGVAPAAGPTPACPQCESPMAWVEEHLRFYCKQCRMYF